LLSGNEVFKEFKLAVRGRLVKLIFDLVAEGARTFSKDNLRSLGVSLHSSRLKGFHNRSLFRDLDLATAFAYSHELL
jgi:hypothetical protein